MLKRIFVVLSLLLLSACGQDCSYMYGNGMYNNNYAYNPNCNINGYGYPNQGYPNTGYPNAGYPNAGYNPGYSPGYYPPTGYPTTGYPPTGYPVGYVPQYYPNTPIAGGVCTPNNPLCYH